MRWMGWGRARAAVMGLGLLCLPVIGTAQTVRHEGTARRPALRRRSETPEGRAREHWAETWERASAKRGERNGRRVRKLRVARTARLCRPSPHGREQCALVHEVVWQR